MTVTPCQDHYDCSECERHLTECLECAKQYYSKQQEGLTFALRQLYDNTANYITVNNLGDIHHNQAMQTARDILIKAGAL